MNDDNSIWVVIVLLWFMVVVVGVSRLPKLNRTKNEEKDPSKCSCGHVFSLHKKTGECNAETFYIDEIRLSKSTNCPCVQYDGVPPGHLYMRED